MGRVTVASSAKYLKIGGRTARRRAETRRGQCTTCPEPTNRRSDCLALAELGDRTAPEPEGASPGSINQFSHSLGRRDGVHGGWSTHPLHKSQSWYGVREVAGHAESTFEIQTSLLGPIIHFTGAACELLTSCLSSHSKTTLCCHDDTTQGMRCSQVPGADGNCLCARD
jgi:hypothetical protein